MRFFRIAVLFIPVLFHLVCTNTPPHNPVIWQVRYSLPLVCERFTVSMLGLKSKNIIDDSTRTGDTLFAQRVDTLYRQYYSTLFSLPPLDNTWHTGSCILKKIPVIESTPGVSSDQLFTLKKSSSHSSYSSHELVDTISISGIERVYFETSSQTVIAYVYNNDQSTSVTNMNMSIISMYDTLKFNQVPLLTPGDSMPVMAYIGNKTIGSSLILVCRYDTDSSEDCSKPANLRFRINFNGLSFASGVLNDSLVTFTFSHSLHLPFGQKGFATSYIDIQNFQLPFIIKNSLPFELNLNISINNIWSIDYCKSRSITSSEDLNTHTLDSTFFKGNTFLTLSLPSGETRNQQSGDTFYVGLNDVRLLPDWNPRDTINRLDISLHGTAGIRGNRITIDNIEQTGAKLEQLQLNIQAIAGEYAVETRIRNRPVMVPIIVQNSLSDITKNLKNRLIPENTILRFTTAFDIPDSTFFESIDFSCDIFETDSSQIIDSRSFSMDSISAGKEFSYTGNFGNLLMRLPDSLGYVLSYIIKPGKKIFLDSKVLHFDNNLLFARFDAEIISNMTLYLVWGILDTISIHAHRKTGAFPIAPQSIRLMKSKELTLTIQLTNNSNITGRLRATATDVLSSSTNDNHITTFLLGEKGILLPSRGKTVENQYSFIQKDLEHLTSPESLDIDWILDLFPCETDAVLDTDYIDINAEMVLEGEHSTESFFLN